MGRIVTIIIEIFHLRLNQAFLITAQGNGSSTDCGENDCQYSKAIVIMFGWILGKLQEFNTKDSKIVQFEIFAGYLM